MTGQKYSSNQNEEKKSTEMRSVTNIFDYSRNISYSIINGKDDEKCLIFDFFFFKQASAAVKRIIPLFDRVLVERFAKETKSKGGIHIPEKALGKVLNATVIAVGKGLKQKVSKFDLDFSIKKKSFSKISGWYSSSSECSNR